ncbi:MAG TPA: O-antigen ligase family protein [Pirellulales bacterium]|nr:O-antigen ligase family protein [Pirellulales bacterium]
MDGISLLLALVAVVAVAVYCLRVPTLVGACVTILAAAVFGVEFWHLDAALPVTIDRVFLVGTVVAFVVQRRLGQTDPKRLLTVDKILVLFLGLLTVSFFLSDFHDPKEQAISQFRLMVGYLIPATLYYVARQSRFTERNLSFVRGAFFCLGVYLGFTAICEFTKTWWLVFPWQIADPTVGLHYGRARGPMVHSVSFGLCLGTCFLASWIWRSHLSPLKQRWVLLFLPLMLVGIVLSLTRSVWIGAGLSTIALLGLTLRGSVRRAFLAVAIASVIVVVVVRPENLIAFKREESAENTEQSAELRKSFVYISWQMFKDKPIWGFGFGTFYWEKMPYLHDRRTDLLLEPIRDWVHHNTFLSILTETGAVGFALFLALLGGWAYNGWRLLRCAQAPRWVRWQGALTLAQLLLYSTQLLFHELSYAVIDSALVYFTAGITVGLRAQWDVAPERVSAERIAAAQNARPLAWAWKPATGGASA